MQKDEKRPRRSSLSCAWLLFPRPWLLPPVALLAAAGLVCALTPPGVPRPVEIAAYLFSTWALVVLCARVPALVRAVRRVEAKSPFLRRYRSDARLRVALSLGFSLLLNGLYALFHLYLGVRGRSLWYCALACYYGLLLQMRCLLLRQLRRSREGMDLRAEYRCLRACGQVLSALHIALGVIVFFIVQRAQGFVHGPIVTIAMAAYTFYSLGMALFNVVRYRRYHSPVLSAAKAVNLSAALVSMLALETAMISAFGDTDEVFRRAMTGATGSAVCLAVLGIGTYMAIRGSRGLRATRTES